MVELLFMKKALCLPQWWLAMKERTTAIYPLHCRQGHQQMPCSECMVSYSSLLLVINNIMLPHALVPPMLGPLPLEYVFLEGDVNRTLDCFGSGDPEPAVHWLKDGLVLPFPRQHVRQ